MDRADATGARVGFREDGVAGLRNLKLDPIGIRAGLVSSPGILEVRVRVPSSLQ